MTTTNELAKLAQLLNVNSSSVGIGNTTVNTSLSVSGSNISPVQSFRNKIINGNFDIWQRGTSTSTNGAYCADRWLTSSTGSTFTSSRQAFTLGQTDVPNEPSYWHRTVVTSVAGAGNYIIWGQRIESVRSCAGKTIAISFWAKADASKNIAIEFIQNFGTGGSPSSTVTGIGVTTCTLTTTWTKFTSTVTIPSISGKTIGSDNNDYVAINFWLNAGSTFNSRTNSLGQASGTYDFSQVQIEEGSVTTPFEMRPIGIELNLCYRYYCFDNNEYHMLPAPGATFASMYQVKYPVDMRATATLAFNYTSSYAIGSYTSYNINNKGFRHFISASISTNASMYFNWTANAEL